MLIGSSLDITASNRINPGESFEPDGWVHKDGRRLRKWFDSLGNIRRVWPPRLKDLAGIERTMWRCKARYESVWMRVEALAEELSAAGITVAEHRDEDVIRKYEITRATDPRTGIPRSCWGLVSSMYSARQQADIRNAAVGAKIHYLYTYLRDCGGRWSTSGRILERAIEEYLLSQLEVHGLRGSRPIRLSINGRDYFHVTRMNRFGGIEFTKLSWPADNEYHAVFGEPETSAP